MNKLSRHDLIGTLNSMLVYAFETIDKWEGHEESKLGEKVKENLRQAHQQIKELIQNQSEVDEEWIKEALTYMICDPLIGYINPIWDKALKRFKDRLQDAGVKVKND